MAGHWTTQAQQPAVPSAQEWGRLKEALGTLGDDVDHLVAQLGATNRPEDWGSRQKSDFLATLADGGRDTLPRYGTALKPAIEPIVLARKPIPRTMAVNVRQWGTGPLSIAATATGDRWPCNVILDPSQEAAIHGRDGSPRFCYTAKPGPAERPTVNGITHPTVKPLALMQWLVRLLTPAGGTVLDTFGGSGATAEAARMEGRPCIIIEREAEYVPLIAARAARAHTPLLL